MSADRQTRVRTPVRPRVRMNELQTQLFESLDSALTKLRVVWDTIGIDDAQRNERTLVVMAHLGNLLDKMVQEEMDLEQKLKNSIDEHKSKVETLRQELALDHFTPLAEGSLVKLEKELREEINSLSKEKKTRLQSLKRLKDKDQHLCDVLVTTPYYIPTGSVPSHEQLAALEKHIEELEEEKEHRHGIFLATRKDIAGILDELGMAPDSSFERDIVVEEEDSFLLSNENMQAVKIYHQQLEVKQQENKLIAEELRQKMTTLWDRLELPEEERDELKTTCAGYKSAAIEEMRDEIERCEKLRLQNMQKFVEGIRKELVTWWDKCYFNERQRHEFHHYRRDDYSEELLQAHELEVSAMKTYYEENKEMLDRVSKREELWHQMIEFDTRAKDLNRFTNRGGNLLAEQKARNKVLKELPKVERKLKQDIEEWERKKGKQFFIYGQPFMEFINTQWAEYQCQKENEKSERLKRKHMETEQEMIYGSKPTTPAKRRFCGTTPSKTPNTTRKLNMTKTPSSMSRLTTTSSVSRLATPRSAQAVNKFGLSRVYSSPALAPRPPRPGVTQKTPSRSTRKGPSQCVVLRERNGDATNGTLSSHNSTSSVASAASYQDFANGVKPNLRSSIMPERAVLHF